MQLHILGSGSKGNCYILDSDSGALVIDAGVPFVEVKQALGFDISRIAGVIVSHEHKDHAGRVFEALDTRLSVYMTQGTAEAVGCDTGYLSVNIVEPMQAHQIGSFRVMPFDVRHDAAEPVGFLIEHKESGRVLFATDTKYIPYTFKDLSQILIEANYRGDLLNDRLPNAVRNRIIDSHMSLDTCIEALRANDLTTVQNIVLLHLSDGNSHAQEFVSAVKSATGVDVVCAAEKGMRIGLNELPF